MSLRRFPPFLLSGLLAASLLLAAVSALAADYGISGNPAGGNATVYTTITSFPQSATQFIPIANATVTGGNFTVVATGTMWSNTTNTNITGTVDGGGNLIVTGPRGSTGNGTVTAGAFNLTCAYLVPSARITYHYVFSLAPTP
jgi:hypothetical protein